MKMIWLLLAVYDCEPAVPTNHPYRVLNIVTRKYSIYSSITLSDLAFHFKPFIVLNVLLESTLNVNKQLTFVL